MLDQTSAGFNPGNRTFYAQYDFKQKVFQTMHQLDKLPQLRKTIQQQMESWREQKLEESAIQGFKGAKMSRINLKMNAQKEEEEYEKKLQKMVENEPNAC